MLKSLLRTFTHITYKGVLSRGFCCVQVNSVVKSLLGTFIHSQNAHEELQRRYQIKFSGKRKP